jgi:hypothetical protein
MKMSIDHWWNNSDRRKTEVLGKNPVPEPLFQPKIWHGLVWDGT